MARVHAPWPGSMLHGQVPCSRYHAPGTRYQVPCSRYQGPCSGRRSSRVAGSRTVLGPNVIKDLVMIWPFMTRIWPYQPVFSLIDPVIWYLGPCNLVPGTLDPVSDPGYCTRSTLYLGTPSQIDVYPSLTRSTSGASGGACTGGVGGCQERGTYQGTYRGPYMTLMALI